jgi:hypothetical protein
VRHSCAGQAEGEGAWISQVALLLAERACQLTSFYNQWVGLRLSNTLWYRLCESLLCFFFFLCVFILPIALYADLVMACHNLSHAPYYDTVDTCYTLFDWAGASLSADIKI